jgi:UDP-glucose-4-epimerase GalE
MIVFSSSAAVYGEPEQIPIPEEHSLRPINVYGRTKVMMEQIMADFEKTYGFRYAALRYFNAAGADPEGEIGEIHDPETHLIPNVLRTALGLQEVLEIYGTDYPTPDGSPIRDYIHVMDLAEAHLLALKHLRKGESLGPINLGTARGFSVLEIVKEAEKVTGLSINRKVTGRREGDPAVLVSSNKRAFERLGWSLRFSDLETIISTAWKFLRRFQNKNG